MRIGKRTRLFVVLMLLLSTGAVAFTVFWGMSQISIRFQQQDLQTNGARVAQLVSVAFEELGKGVSVIGSLNLATEALENDDPESLADLEDLFRKYLEQNPYFSQLRLITVEENGLEVLRLDRLEDQIVRLGDDDLQEKGHRDYFREAIELDPTDVYYSRIDLNREYGEIQVPHVPTLRIAKQVRNDQGELLGLVIGNVLFDAFIDRLLRSELQRFDIFLADEDGYYIFHQDSDKRFGFDLSHEHRVQSDVSESEEFFRVGESSQFFGGDNLFSYSYDLTQLQRLPTLGGDRELVYGAQATYNNFSRQSGLLAVAVIGVAGVFTLLGLALTRYLTLGVTRPLEVIARATDRFARGSVKLALPTSRDDEIGDLARRFSEMRDTIMREQGRVLEMNKRLEAANEDLDHFAHIASHELREPVNRISMLSGLARSRLSALDSEERGAFDEVMKSLHGQSLLALRQITEFRRYSQLGSGNLVREMTDVGDLLANLLEEFKEEIDRRGVVCEVAPIPPLWVYSNLLRVVYRSLIENALKFTEDQAVTIRFTCEPDGEELVLGVSNTGSTIKTEHMDKVFKSLFSLSPDGESAGMGLSISKKIVDRHSGRIWVDSTDGLTHFKFTLSVEALGNNERI